MQSGRSAESGDQDARFMHLCRPAVLCGPARDGPL